MVGVVVDGFEVGTSEDLFGAGIGFDCIKQAHRLGIIVGNLRVIIAARKPGRLAEKVVDAGAIEAHAALFGRDQDLFKLMLGVSVIFGADFCFCIGEGGPDCQVRANIAAGFKERAEHGERVLGTALGNCGVCDVELRLRDDVVVLDARGETQGGLVGLIGGRGVTLEEGDVASGIEDGSGQRIALQVAGDGVGLIEGLGGFVDTSGTGESPGEIGEEGGHVRTLFSLIPEGPDGVLHRRRRLRSGPDIGRTKMDVMATGVEEDKPRPLLWTREVGKGRVFVSIPGHFTWTFDDPLFRILLLRGIAWSAGESVDRFNELATIGGGVGD